jgi:hypothetical protein
VNDLLSATLAQPDGFSPLPLIGMDDQDQTLSP